MEKSKQFLEYLVGQIVNRPDSVVVDGRTDDLGVLLTLRVAKEDTGGVIGRKGDTAKAIRTLVRIVGIREGARVNVRIEEPNGQA